jgi:hypothetical protein
MSEPVSACWFPVPRENTGKFADFELEIAKAPRFRKKIQSLTNGIPSRLNREICGRSGNLRRVTANLIPITGLAVWPPHDLRPQVQILGSKPPIPNTTPLRARSPKIDPNPGLEATYTEHASITNERPGSRSKSRACNHRELTLPPIIV